MQRKLKKKKFFSWDTNIESIFIFSASSCYEPPDAKVTTAGFMGGTGIFIISVIMFSFIIAYLCIKNKELKKSLKEMHDSDKKEEAKSLH